MILRWLVPFLGLLLALASSPAFAKKDKPTITETKFDNPPIGIFYFEDTDTVMFQDPKQSNAWISYDAGESWKVLDADSKMKSRVVAIMPHPFDNKKAYILGSERLHWRTTDQGKTWKSFQVNAYLPAFGPPLAFHGWDSDKILFNTCADILCADEETFYTTDNFENLKSLRKYTYGCTWAAAEPSFAKGLGVEKKIGDRVFCLVDGLSTYSPKQRRLIFSDNFYTEDGGVEAPLDNGRSVAGVISTASVKKYTVAAASSEGTDEEALYVTDDAVHWHRAEFRGHRITEGAYTILESTNYSIQIDVAPSPLSAMGTLFASNSNGTYFSEIIEHTNRKPLFGIPGSYVDFEKIAGIQGIVMVNVVDNYKDFESKRAVEKKIVSRISFDDGRTFQPLKSNGKELHLHSVTDLSNSGRVFSSPAPGLVMGIGNTGDHLKDYTDGDLYVSDDAGITWRQALEDAHKYEFGDQGSVLMAIYDEGRTDKIRFSINHGQDWEKAELPRKIRADQLTTTPDSTSLKFLLVGSAKEGGSLEHYVYSIDFNGLHERKCGKDDFEKWPARLDEGGKPDCLMGHKQFYRRRKPNADCFIDEEFKDPELVTEPCKCTAEDFECDFNFVRSEDRKSCLPVNSLSVPSGQCEDSKGKYKGPSGFRLIPGNDCVRDGGVSLDTETVERDCSDIYKKPATGKVSVEKTVFKGSENWQKYVYRERTGTSGGQDETIFMQTKKKEVFMSSDHGKAWAQLFKNEAVSIMIPNPYFNDDMYFVTGTGEGWVTQDRGKNIHTFKAKLPPNRDREWPMRFHPDDKDWLIWIGADECTSYGDCQSTALATTNRGGDWKTLLRSVHKCDWVPRQGFEESNKLIFCEQYRREDSKSPLQLVASPNWFEDKTVHFDDIIGFATMAEFVVVAAESRTEEQTTLKVDVSVDGRTFADAQFPKNFQVPIQRAYTVLDSSTHAIFLHVTVNNQEGSEYGSILKSNSNGTSYVMSLNGVNRNTGGYVDFEKMQGLEGVALVNVVGNIEEVEKGMPKKLRSMITHNDGAQWAGLPPPAKDSDGVSYGCGSQDGVPTTKCALHLHGYTERADPEDTFSSPSAVGVMLGVGNVGEYLGLKDEGDTFITRDGGITWQVAKKGAFMWEYGDQGSIIVIVKEAKPTKVVYYTLDEGRTWEEFQFSDVDMNIEDISTLPSDSSKMFLLWGREVGDKATFVTVNLDFSGIRDRQCKLQESNAEGDDYWLWEPKHPLQDSNCLFGHVAQYHRKRLEADCWNGQNIQHIHNIAQNCTCTKQDFECDYNYEPQGDGSCTLVPGLQPVDHSEVCRNDPTAIEFFEPTGYRRIPLSTCEGGLELDHIVSHPCPDKEEEYRQKHGLSGAGLFFAIVVPIAAAAGIGYWAYSKWDGKFGQIQLGDGGVSTSSVFSGSSLLVTIPVAIVAGTVAVAKALPLLAMSLWRSASGYVRIPGRGRDGFSSRPYASRGAFAARRGDYVGVVEDEDELLGTDDLDVEEEDEV